MGGYPRFMTRNLGPRLAVTAMLAFCSVWVTSQMSPKDKDPAPPTGPTKDDIPKAKAISIAQSAMKTFGFSSAAVSSAAFSYPRNRMQAGTWLVRCGPSVLVAIHGRSGMVLEITDQKALDAVSHERMKRRAKGEVAKPVIDPMKLPASFLLSPKSKLSFNNKPNQYNCDTIGWKAMAHLKEMPAGMPIVNAENLIMLEFDPRNGDLLSFGRTCAYAIPAASPKLAAAKAKAIAAKAKLELRRGARNAEGTAPMLGFLAPAGQRGQARNDGALSLVWIVPLPKSEIWVDASTGKVLGGRDTTAATGPRRQGSRIGIG